MYNNLGAPISNDSGWMQSNASTKTAPATATPPSENRGILASIESIVRGFGTGLQVYNQQRLANENLERARLGLRPLTYSDVPGMVPTASVGLDANTNRTAMLALLMGGGALLLLLTRKGGRRK